MAGIDRWGGINTEGDPASIPDNCLVYTQNTRLSGGKILSRGGQAAVNTVATNGCIDGFFDAGDMGAQDPASFAYEACSVGTGSSVSTRLYLAGDGVLDPTVSYYDETNLVVLHSEDYGGSGRTANLLAADGTLNKVIVGVQNLVYTLAENSAVPALAFTSTTSAMFLASYAKFGANHYFGRVETASNAPFSTSDSDVCVWNGTDLSGGTYELAESNTGRWPLLAAYNSDLYACYTSDTRTSGGPNTTTNTLYYRNGGAWTNITFPIDRFVANHMVVIGSDLWIAGVQYLNDADGQPKVGKIVKVNGTTATVERTINGGASFGAQVKQIIPDGGDFYYLWTHEDNTDTLIGSCLSSVYTDSAKTINSSSLSPRYLGKIGSNHYFANVSGGLVLESTTNLTGTYTTLTDAGQCFTYAAVTGTNGIGQGNLAVVF